MNSNINESSLVEANTNTASKNQTGGSYEHTTSRLPLRNT